MTKLYFLEIDYKENCTKIFVNNVSGEFLFVSKEFLQSNWYIKYNRWVK